MTDNGSRGMRMESVFTADTSIQKRSNHYKNSSHSLIYLFIS
jgi:hypothetical protein